MYNFTKSRLRLQKLYTRFFKFNHTRLYNEASDRVDLHRHRPCLQRLLNTLWWSVYDYGVSLPVEQLQSNAA